MEAPLFLYCTVSLWLIQSVINTIILFLPQSKTILHQTLFSNTAVWNMKSLWIYCKYLFDIMVCRVCYDCKRERERGEVNTLNTCRRCINCHITQDSSPAHSLLRGNDQKMATTQKHLHSHDRYAQTSREGVLC